MIYMLQILYDPSIPVDPNRPSLQPQHAALEQELRAEGIYRGGGGMWPAGAGPHLELRNGVSRVIDGPFTESKEVLGGFFVIECDTPDQALAVAVRIPTGEHAWIDLRRVGIWRPE